MTETANLWRVVISATAESVNAFEEALNPFCEAIFWFATDREEEWRITGLSQSKPDGAMLATALSVVASVFSITVPEIFIEPVAPRDWVADNLRMFPPNNVGRFFIYGTHYHSPLPVGLIPILLNPGRAFGSGDHATTMGCLLAISDLAGKRKFKKPIDMGCGSGILSIALAKAWRVPVCAFDVDTNAVLAAKENIRRNGVASLVRASRSSGYASLEVKKAAPYDLIVSNILANTLCQMAKNMSQISRNIPMGSCVVILAGFHDCDANRVYAAHYAQGFRLVRSYHIKGWCTFVLKR
jgi:ribosomal protein L11 methyltransferase